MSVISKVVEIKVKVADAIDEVKDLFNEMVAVEEQSAKVEKTGTASFDAMSGAVEGMIPGIGGAVNGFKAMLKQMWLIVTNPLGLILVAIVGSLTLLYKAFTSTNDGADKMEQTMAGLSAAIDVVRDRILIAGEAIVKFFSGDFKGAMESGKMAVKGFGEEVAREFKIAADAVKSLQEVEDAMLSISVARAKLDRDLAKSKELLTDENASYAQKKKALEEIKVAEGSLSKQELENAEKKLKAIVAQNALSDTSDEDLKKEADARIALYNIQKKSAEDSRNINKQEQRAFKDEQGRLKVISDERKQAFKEKQDILKAEQKLKEEEAKKILETEEARQKAILDIRKSYANKLEDLEDDTQLKKLDRQEKRALEELEKLKGTEDEKTELLKYYANLRIANEEEIKAKEFDKELTKKAKDAEDSELSFQERLTLLAERDAMILGNEKLTEEERTKFFKENADARIKIAQLEAKAKSDALQSYGDALGSIADLIGESTVVGKVAAVASAGISTYLSAQKAYESQMLIPSPDAPIRAALAAGVAVASGLANVKAILSVKTPKGGGGGGSAPSISTPSASAPNFNIVGATGLDNQIATGLGTTKQAPIKAYVVSTEVSSQQSLDRNIKDNATLG